MDQKSVDGRIVEVWARVNITNPVEVRYPNPNNPIAIVLAVLVSLFLLVMMIAVVLGIAGISFFSVLLIIAGVSLFLVLFLTVRGYRARLIKTFDKAGVTLRGGKRFPWTELIAVEYNEPTKAKGAVCERVQLVFASGRGAVGLGTTFGVFAGPDNVIQVLSLINALPVEHKQTRFGYL